MIVKLITPNQGTRSTYTEITNEFTSVSNWNAYSVGNTVKNDEGVKYEYVGVAINSILLKKIAENDK
jgi:hypothetical protein